MPVYFFERGRRRVSMRQDEILSKVCYELGEMFGKTFTRDSVVELTDEQRKNLCDNLGLTPADIPDGTTVTEICEAIAKIKQNNN